MPNVGRQIIGSFEDIGKSVVNEAVKVPADIAGKAMESLGTVSGKTQNATTVKKTGSGGEVSKNSDEWDAFDGTKDNQVKQSIARAAIFALVNRNKPKGPSVRERLEAEAEQQKKIAEKKIKEMAEDQIPLISAKRPAGDLYGKHAKQTSVENKNVKSD
jgi:hypothetical protein